MDTQTRLNNLKAQAEKIRDRKATYQAQLKTLEQQIELEADALSTAGFPIDDGVDAIMAEIKQREDAIEASLAEAEKQAAEGKAILDRIDSGGNADAI